MSSLSSWQNIEYFIQRLKKNITPDEVERTALCILAGRLSPNQREALSDLCPRLTWDDLCY